MEASAAGVAPGGATGSRPPRAPVKPGHATPNASPSTRPRYPATSPHAIRTRRSSPAPVSVSVYTVVQMHNTACIFSIDSD